jgi:hypothetical protein
MARVLIWTQTLTGSWRVAAAAARVLVGSTRERVSRSMLAGVGRRSTIAPQRLMSADPASSSAQGPTEAPSQTTPRPGRVRGRGSCEDDDVVVAGGEIGGDATTERSGATGENDLHRTILSGVSRARRSAGVNDGRAVHSAAMSSMRSAESNSTVPREPFRSLVSRSASRTCPWQRCWT